MAEHNAASAAEGTEALTTVLAANNGGLPERVEPEKIDRRVRRTKQQLRSALTTLLLEKDFSDITVREISERADVNRGTFYSHYRDAFDLLTSVEDFFLEAVRRIDLKIQRQDWEGATYRYLEDLFTLIRDNADVCRALMCGNGDPAFQQRLLTMFKNQFLHRFLEEACRTEERVQEYYCVYIEAGLRALIGHWMQGGMREAPPEMARIGGDFIIRGIKGLR